MIRILTVLGARPQFIKAAALSKAIAQNANFQEVLVHTGQHFDENMSAVFFREMGIPKPKYNLNIHSQSHAAMTGKMLMALERVLVDERPDLVIVYGDTNSTLAGALAASKLHVPVAHIEAGLRSRNMKMPEEVNRIITDKVSRFLFCPSAESARNLTAEGLAPNKIFEVGDIMLDSLNLHRQKANTREVLRELGVDQPYVLATLHRQENLSERKRLEEIFAALEEVNRSCMVIVPVHPALRKVLSSSASKLKLVEPQSYLKMLGLLESCEMVFTDSGGLQKEAYYMQKHCITLRDETEWVELVDAGVNKLAGANGQAIIEWFKYFTHRKFTAAPDIYGEGNSTQKILQALSSAY